MSASLSLLTVEAVERHSQIRWHMALQDLRKNAMMSHLLDALDRGQDIGHYGRLTFAMIARHFLSEDELCAWLAKDPGVSEHDARVLWKQVEGRDYNPPKRERILEWQKEQSFPICPDPNGCNVYRDLEFPEHVYRHIQEFYEEQVKSGR